MFGINFTELIIIGVVALIVLGPERLPKVAKTIGVILGRAQRYVNDIKSDIHREIEATELNKIRQEVEESAKALENTIRSNVTDIETSLQDSAKEVQSPLEQVRADILRLQEQASSQVDESAIPSVEAHDGVAHQQPVEEYHRSADVHMPIQGGEQADNVYETAPETIAAANEKTYPDR